MFLGKLTLCGGGEGVRGGVTSRGGVVTWIIYCTAVYRKPLVIKETPTERVQEVSTVRFALLLIKKLYAENFKPSVVDFTCFLLQMPENKSHVNKRTPCFA